jgi:hypothetical protein
MGPDVGGVQVGRLVDHDPVASPPLRQRDKLDRSARMGGIRPPDEPGTAEPEHGPIDGEQGRLLASERRHGEVADREHPAMQPDQPAGADAMRDCSAAQSEGAQLLERDAAALPPGDLSDASDRRAKRQVRRRPGEPPDVPQLCDAERQAPAGAHREPDVSHAEDERPRGPPSLTSRR